MDVTSSPTGLIDVFPEHLTYGIISVGFLYRLKFSVKNNSLEPLRVRIVYIPAQDERNSVRLVTFPEKIAPGIAYNLLLELSAEYVGSTHFTMHVTNDRNENVFSRLVEANVVTVETFKHVKKSLQLQKRPVYRYNVEVVGPCPTAEQLTMIHSKTTLSENVLMDEEEIEDILDLPVTKNMYWDAVDKCLRIDPILCQVHVDATIDLEESQAKTKYLRKKRLTELEDQGFLTYKAIDRIRVTNDEKSLYTLSLNEEDAELLSPGAEFGTSIQSGRSSPEPDSGDELGDEEGDEFTAGTGTQTHTMSVTSLLAMKRDKIEKQRKESVDLANKFSSTSRNDVGVNSQRTLNMINSRPKSVVPVNLVD